MAYTKTTWEHDTKFTTTNLNNCETQYDEAYSYAVLHNHDGRYYTQTECDAWFWYAGNDGAGSGCDADLIYKSGGNYHYASFGSGNISANTIIMWDNAVLPSGWTICDGTSGTPDLRAYFVVGAGTGGPAVGATGGNNSWSQSYTITVASHTLTTDELPAHTHVWQDTYCSNLSGRGSGSSANNAEEAIHTGTTSSTGGGLGHGHTSSTVTQASADNKPPCVALYYIMKT